MIRCTVVVAFFAGAAALACAQDKDPIKEKLQAAKTAYDKETEQFQKQVADWLDKQEATARKAGDKKLLDQTKSDRQAFVDDGNLPTTLPAALKQKPVQARKAMDTAYDAAVKAYTKAKKDDQAAAVAEAWTAFQKSGPPDMILLVDPKAHRVAGEWKVDGKSLVGKAKDDKYATIQFPYEPGAEYDLEIKG